MRKGKKQAHLVLLVLFTLLFGAAFAGCRYTAPGSYTPSVIQNNVGINYFISKISPDRIIDEPVQSGRTTNAPDDPDLVIVSITPSTEQPSKDDHVTFTVSFTNQGGSVAHTSFIAFSVDGRNVLTRDIGVVEPGQTKTEEFDWVADYGTHTFRFQVDANGQVPESDETNNISEISLSTLIPDLKLGELTLSPKIPYEGDSVTFSVMVVNNGTGDSVASLIRPVVNNQQQPAFFVPAISSGANTTVSFSYVVSPGPLNIQFTVDPENAVIESDETNNTRDYDLEAILPDLIISNFGWTPLEPATDESVQFSATVKNQGRATSGPTRLSYYIGSRTSGYVVVPELAANTTHSSNFNWTASLIDGQARLVIDSGSLVKESDEENNEVTANMTIRSADLVVRNISWTPSHPSAGDKLTITAEILNQGTANASPSTTSLYIDDELFSTDRLNGISVNSTDNATFTWTALDGTYEFRVRADAESTILESHEENNETTVSYPFPPDLVVDSLEWEPAVFTEGDTIVFNFRVTNQGQGRSDTSFAGMYIDNTYLGIYPISALDPGQSENGTYEWVAVAGLHSFTVTADQTEKIAELNNGNNDRADSFVVSSKVDEAEATSENQTSESENTETKKPPTPIQLNNSVPRDNSGQLLFLALGGGGALIVGFIIYDMLRRLRH